MVEIDHHAYGAHVLIWVWMTGEWPSVEIDHENLKRADNRWSNLREATHSQNMANGRKYRNNTSGYKGVFWENRKSPKKWRAMIDINGKHKHLGYHSSKEEASAAYNKAADELFGEFARTT